MKQITLKEVFYATVFLLGIALYCCLNRYSFFIDQDDLIYYRQDKITGEIWMKVSDIKGWFKVSDLGISIDSHLKLSTKDTIQEIKKDTVNPFAEGDRYLEILNRETLIEEEKLDKE